MPHGLQIPLMLCSSEVGSLSTQTPRLLIKTKGSELPHMLHLLMPRKKRENNKNKHNLYFDWFSIGFICS